MNLEALAPWIAIAITLALSILVPLFTQIANNRHQRKLQKERFNREDAEKKKRAYEDFLLNVCGVFFTGKCTTKEAINQAGSSLHLLYIYAPKEWYDDLDALAKHLANFEWEQGMPIIQKMSRLIAETIEK